METKLNFESEEELIKYFNENYSFSDAEPRCKERKIEVFVGNNKTLISTNDIWQLGKKSFAICPFCNKTIQTNKRFFGAFHLCTTPEERDRIEKERCKELQQQGWQL